MIEILPVRGIDEVIPGADLAEMIVRAAPWLRDGDVLVVTSKIVSKAEGRLVPVPEDGPDRERARDQAIASETARVVASRGPTRIVVTHHGFVMAAAGVDTSNVRRSHLALLPKDPDASARTLRAALAERFDRRVAVILSDTTGRPWRNGLTDVALGVAGIDPLRDHRGQLDPHGNELQLTQMAVADELAAAAELVKGKADRVPVAVVRGVPEVLDEDGPGAVAGLVRTPAEDLFSLGTAEARVAGLREAAALPDAGELPTAPADLAEVRRAVATVAADIATFEVGRLDEGGFDVAVAEEVKALGSGSGDAGPVRAGAGEPAVRCSVPDPADPATLVRLGTDVHRLRAALAAEGLTSAVAFPAPGQVVVRVGRRHGDHTAG